MIWGAFLLFCFSAFKYQILPTATVCVHLEYNSAKSHGVYNIGILHGLKSTTSHAKPPTNNNKIILRGPLGLLPLSISKLRHKHTKKVLPKGL